MNVTILSVRYEEFSWLKTREDIENTNLPVVYVDRKPKGLGSLSEAINRGVKEIEDEYVFLCTNINFKKSVIEGLYNRIKELPQAAAICPVYKSDHSHLRPSSYAFGYDLFEVPFVEFTTGIFRTDLLKRFPLDEDMPYCGMDLHWSKQVKDAGYTLHSLKSVEIDHTYIRNCPGEKITRKRLALRKQADAGTIAKLESIYGKDWRKAVGYYNGIASR